jgi:membrane fusion protein, heavy metal efflux system
VIPNTLERFLRSALLFVSLVGLSLTVTSCSATKADPAAEDPPPVEVVRQPDAGTVVTPEHPDEFPLAVATAYSAAPDLNVTGVVGADVSRTIPVISLASGRVIEVLARLGDYVTKGQVLLTVQSSDISNAYSDYQQAVADERLARSQLERANTLYEKGAIAKKDVETATDTEAKAQVTVQTTLEHLRVLGADPAQRSAIVSVKAPASGVITEQQITNAAGVQGLASPNPFTISDLSSVWVMCDVYENDLPQVRVGEYADVRLNAYPDRVFKGRIGNISPVLDPSLRTAKVRLELRNPGIIRLGMFVTATFHGARTATYAAVPAAAVLHLHDRDWVYTPSGGREFKRVAVSAGRMLAGSMQEITSGLAPGQQVVADALSLHTTAEQ